MRSRRLLIHGPEGEPLSVCLYVQAIGTTWAAMIVADGGSPLEPCSLNGIGCFAGTAEWEAALSVGCPGEEQSAIWRKRPRGENDECP